MKNIALLLAPLAVFASFAEEARATPSAPATLREHLGMSCAVECTTCHESNFASRGNATRPFALSVVDELSRLELDITSEGALERAIDAIEEAGSDSDEDQRGDIEELLANPPSNPSEAGDGSVCAPEIGYGCGSEFAGRSSRGAALLLVVSSAFLGAFVRRSRRPVVRGVDS